MRLPTTGPWKHPDSGIYYVREAVAVRLRALVGKSLEKVSLGTHDPDEARRRHAKAVIETNNLAKVVAAAIQRASLIVERHALGDVPGDDRLPNTHLVAPTPATRRTQTRASVTFNDLVNGWAAERMRPVMAAVDGIAHSAEA